MLVCLLSYTCGGQRLTSGVLCHIPSCYCCYYFKEESVAGLKLSVSARLAGSELIFVPQP